MNVNPKQMFISILHSYIFVLALLSLTMVASNSYANVDMKITVAATDNAINHYENLPDSAKKVPINPDTIPAALDRRCVIGIMIIKNALKLGGINPQLDFIPMPNVRRETDEIAKGNALLGSHLLDKTTLNIPGYKSKIYLSSSVIESKVFQKGIYCLPDNEKILAVKNASELKAAGKAIVGIHWKNDQQILKQMGITDIVTGPTTCSLFKMIKAGRADWIPLGFRNPPDMSISRAGIKLVPVQGIKISMIEGSHILISKRHPHGQAVYEAIEKGLSIMKQQNLIIKMLAQGGYTCPASQGWKRINRPPQTDAAVN